MIRVFLGALLGLAAFAMVGLLTTIALMLFATFGKTAIIVTLLAMFFMLIGAMITTDGFRDFK